MSSDERRELERYRRKEREDEQDRIALRELQAREKDDPQGAKMVMTMMAIMQAKNLRAAERELREVQEECDSTKDILTVTQSELEISIEEMREYKLKAVTLQNELDMLKRVRWENATQRSQEHKAQIDALKEKLNRAKEKIASKNRQLARRKKELAAKRNLVNAHKLELDAKGREHEQACEKTRDELRRTKKELEILRELDSFGDSFTFSECNDSSLLWE